MSPNFDPDDDEFTAHIADQGDELAMREVFNLDDITLLALTWSNQ